ncbi:glycosyltransferase family 2 protein [Aciduricibacillus chroicocephali]|uniref:4,4'-diaponeurosporenoate glycosyltransferase n=1 Tax=Aciduricibacillus chroicocephali TaxID=3054939 RepID=A0ABY9KZA8_9BACI|nr:glycosyltransferase family 2 protein [Bacillaceae bacterium 44XB]
MMILCSILILAGLVSGWVMFWRVPEPGRKKINTSIKEISLTVIIPARNEEKRISYLLETLQQQKLKVDEIIVVDDGSTDRTRDISMEFGVKVVQNSELNPGWSGKSLACWNGAKAANGDLLLFMDADTVLSDEKAIGKVIAAYQSEGGTGILSLQPYHVVRKSFENISSIFNIIVMTGVNAFTVFKNKFRSAGSFGPFILCRRDEYFYAGGHEHIQAAIMDDLALGEAFQNKQLPVRCFGGKGIVGYSIYSESLHSLLGGWIKNFATASKSTNPFVMTMINSWIAGGLVNLLFIIWSLIAVHGSWHNYLLPVILYTVYAVQFYFLARKTGTYNWWVYPIFPLLIIVFTGTFLTSVYFTKVRKSVTWRGRKIKV